MTFPHGSPTSTAHPVATRNGGARSETRRDCNSAARCRTRRPRRGRRRQRARCRCRVPRSRPLPGRPPDAVQSPLESTPRVSAVAQAASFGPMFGRVSRFVTVPTPSIRRGRARHPARRRSGGAGRGRPPRAEVGPVPPAAARADLTPPIGQADQPPAPVFGVGCQLHQAAACEPVDELAERGGVQDQAFPQRRKRRGPDLLDDPQQRKLRAGDPVGGLDVLPEPRPCVVQPPTSGSRRPGVAW